MAVVDRNKRSEPDPARAAAARLLFAVLEEGAYSNLSSLKILDEDKLDSRDRSFASAAVYGTVSWLPTIDWYLEQVSAKPLNKLEAWTRTILRLGIWQLTQARNIPESAAVNESVELARYFLHQGAASFVNGVLRGWLRKQPVIPRKLESLEFGLPTWLYGLLRHWYGKERARSLAQAFLESQPWTNLRVNLLAAAPADLIMQWQADGLEAKPGLYLNQAVRLKLAGHSLRDLAAWQDGLVTAQDEAAMLTCQLARPVQNSRIIDLCAAPGGKTTHLAELSDDKAEITALELQPHRAELIEQQAERLGLNSIRTVVGDAVIYGTDVKKFDLVLADVPCSGLGLLGRKPELRINMNYDRIQELIMLQRQILGNAARLVKAGGSLIYSTCTINPEENQNQIKWLLETSEFSSGFRPVNLMARLPAALLSADPKLSEQAQLGFIQLLPDTHHTDGFFIAILERI